MPWTETVSLSFTARHESSEADAVMAVLESLEAHRMRLEQLFQVVPTGITLVLHDSSLQLALAQPFFPLARRMTSPAGRRYMTGWAGGREIHTLAPQALRTLAGGPDSLKALMLSPHRTYTSLVVGTNNALLPPPYRPSTFRNYTRLAWLAEGAAQFFSGQVAHLRAALARQLRGRAPSLPPSLRDALLLGGSVFDLLERERGMDACVRLALHERVERSEAIVEQAFGSPLANVRERWHSHLEQLARAEPTVTLERRAGEGR